MEALAMLVLIALGIVAFVAAIGLVFLVASFVWVVLLTVLSMGALVVIRCWPLIVLAGGYVALMYAFGAWA